MTNSQFVFAWILRLTLVYKALPVNGGDAVPVLIWDGETTGSPSISVNPLQKTSAVEFEKIVMNKMGRSQRPVLIFVRDNLCVEDFIRHKEGLMHLKDDGTLIYVPAVDSPLSVFKNLSFYTETTEEELESVSDGQLVITMAADLDAISETFNMVKASSPNLIAVLTGRSCSYSESERERVRRAVADTPTSEPAPTEGFVVTKGRILLWASETPTLKVSESTDVVVDYVGVVEEGEGTAESPLLLNFEYSVKNTTNPTKANLLLRFPVKSSGYYNIEAVYREADKDMPLASSLDLAFPYNFSYHCSQNVGFFNSTVTFDIADFQVQIDARKFSDAYDCVGFTSIPIWAGIFVTAILALIMIWGLTMIMDIRTMDRFDDPKGKTITISTAE